MRTFAVLFAVCVAPAFSQSRQPAQPGRIGGRVVNALTGEPIRKAAVQILPSGRGDNVNPKYTTTNSDGRFLFEGVQPASWRLTAERNGFLMLEDARAVRRSRGLTVNLDSGQDTTNLEIKLTPQGVVTGTVLDPDGDPLPRVPVRVLPARSGSQAEAGRMGSGDTTNDLGEFRIAGLSPGKYWVLASAPPRRYPPNLEGAPTESTMPTYFPSGASSAEAIPVEVNPGQTTTGIQIQVRRSSVHRISGQVSGLPPDTNPRMFRIMLFPAERATGGPRMGGGPGGQLRPDGTFEITGVLPGRYVLAALRNARGGSGVSGRLEITVSGDLEGLTIPLGAPVTVSGAVKVEGGAPAELGRLNAMLLPDSVVPMGAVNARLKEDLTFQIENVSQGKYFLNLNGLPTGYYLKSVRMGTEECIDNGIDLTSAGSQATLAVTLGTKPASIRGAVAEDGKPMPGVNVMAVPDPAHPNRMFRVYSARTDANGAFQIQGVAPGEYRVYAGDFLSANVVNDPDFRKANEAHSEKVSLSEGASETVELKSLVVP